MKLANHTSFLACLVAGVAYIGAAWLVLRILGVSDSEMRLSDMDEIKRRNGNE